MKKITKTCIFAAVIMIAMAFPVTAKAESDRATALRAYAAYLSQDSIKRKVEAFSDASLDYYTLKKCKFAVANIGDDNIPELVIINDNYDALICTYHDGKVVQLIEFWVNYLNMETTRYYLNTGYIMNVYESSTDRYYKEYYEIDDTVPYAKLAFEKVEELSDYDDNGTLDTKYYEYDDDDAYTISESSFNSDVKRYTRGKNGKRFDTYNNTAGNRKKILNSADGSDPVSLNKTYLYMNKGKTYQLKLKSASGKVSWSSSNKKIADVSSTGKVTARGSGTASVSAVYKGKKYKCSIYVSSEFYTTPYLFATSNGGFYFKIDSVGWSGLTYSFNMPFCSGNSLSAKIRPDGKTAVSYITCSRSSQSHKLVLTIISNGIRVTEHTNCSNPVLRLYDGEKKSVFVRNCYPESMWY